MVINSRDEDLAVGGNKGTHDSEKVGHRLVNGTTKDTRVQISAGTIDGKMKVRDTTKTICQARLGGSEPVVVRNADSVDISKVLVGFSQNKVIKTLRTRLLHTLKAHLQVNGKFNTQVLVGFDNVKPSKNRTLVISATTTKKATLIIFDKLERISVPAVFLESLINVGTASTSCSTTLNETQTIHLQAEHHNVHRRVQSSWKSRCHR